MMREKRAEPLDNLPWPELPSLLPPSIDESPELHDPYSDLNLFLAQKVKEELKTVGTEKKWSITIQEKLIEKITPEFKRRFPYYRLGIAALKKIWEKIAYFASIFESQKEALTEDGKVNIRFLIRENLKQHLGTKKNFSFHPYLLAQQLALKITECLATYDGIRPLLRHITTLIWAVERHLIPPEQVPSLVDDADAEDKLILKCMLEALGKNPHLSQDDLHRQVRQTLHTLKQLPDDLNTNCVLDTLASPLLSEPAALRCLREEISHLLIDNPDQSPTDAAKAALEFLTQAKKLITAADWIEIEHKITLWTIQGDLVYRFVRIEENPLLRLLQDKENAPLREILHAYLRRYPSLKSFAPQIAARVRILSRYIWYTLRSAPSQSTVQRFFQWHLQRLSGPTKIDQLEEICKKQLPLLPFDRKTLGLAKQ